MYPSAGSVACLASIDQPSGIDQAGWQVNDKRIERLWRREGLKVPMKQPRKDGCG